MPVPCVIIVALLLAAGTVILGFTAVSGTRSILAARWPVSVATIVKCSQEFYVSGRSNNQYVRVAYTYSVGGRLLQGSRLAFGYAGNKFSDEDDRIFETLRMAQKVKVRYKPANPSVSTLSCGFHRSLRFGAGFSIAWFSFIIEFWNGWLQGPLSCAVGSGVTLCIGVAVMIRAALHDDGTLCRNLATCQNDAVAA
jgi:hypothetical protein